MLGYNSSYLVYSTVHSSRLDERRCSSHSTRQVAQIHWAKSRVLQRGPNSTLHGHRTQQVPLLRLKRDSSQPELTTTFQPSEPSRTTGGSPPSLHRQTEVRTICRNSSVPGLKNELKLTTRRECSWYLSQSLEIIFFSGKMGNVYVDNN